MGHALNGSIQDVLIRWHRMRGFDTLWQPGYDHAGISTQNVVEKQLIAEGTSRQEIGRDAFLERTWSWLETTGRTIMGQYRRLGASLDYSRERFTMDEAYVEAVMTFFVRLWDAGWIYRANRIVNWCPYHLTAISDLEVEHVEMDDTLSFVRYPFVDGEGGIAVATVRPATMLADVAVAVHPDDPRYRDAIGREVVVPVVERRVPVIADARVDPEFGTGAVKVTPGHDPMDFDIGRDHGLETLTVIGLDGRMIAEGFEGLDQKEADARVIAWADERGLVQKREPYRHSVGTCERCHSRIEPLVSPQWWCAMEGLAAPALEALRERRVRFHPESQHRFANESLEQAPDWCVSRQLWWGHQIPIWTCADGHLTCAWPPPDACAECGNARARARSRRPRHVVLVRAVAVRHARLARGNTGARSLLPRQRQLDRARDHPALGEPDDLLRPLQPRGDPVHRRDHPLDRPRSRRAAHVEEPRHRCRPDAADRGTWCRCDPLRAPQDLLDAGRSLCGGRDRGGPQAREQALERRAADPAADGRRHPGAAPRVARGAMDPRAARVGPQDGRGGVGGLRLRGRDRSALPPHVRRLLRLVRRGDQAASLRRRRGLPRDGAGRARDAALAAPPAHAARDGGDLVAPALQGHTVDRLALAGAGCGGCRRGRAPSIA